MINNTFIASINVSRYSLSDIYAKGPYNIKEMLHFQIHGATFPLFGSTFAPHVHPNEPVYENIRPKGSGNKKPSAPCSGRFLGDGTVAG
jgi:hypothetical protein